MRHWLSTAISFYNQNKLEEAEKLFLNILRKNPNEINTLNYLSIISYRKKELQKARKYCESLLSIKPDDPEFLNRRGQIDLVSGLPESSINYFTKALNQSYQPNYLFNLARAYFLLNNLKESINFLNQALISNPSSTRFRVLLIEIYLRQNQRALINSEAEKIINNDVFEESSYIKLAEMLIQVELIVTLKPVLERILKSSPLNTFALYNLGMIHFKNGKFSDSLPFLNKAFKLDRTIRYFRTLLYLIYAKRAVCDWEGLDVLVRLIPNLTEKYLSQKEVFQLPVYILNYFRLDRNIHKELSSHQSKIIASQIRFKFSHVRKRKRGEKLRIGYISTKFNISPGGILFLDVFSKHDKSKFETFGYTLKSTNDFIEKKYYGEFDHFTDLSKVNDQMASKIIHDDKIDILVTMAGHSDDMRLSILASKPAPLQLNWEGYNESIGSEFIDYSILDETLVNDKTLDFYEESIIVLPGCAMFNSPLETSEVLTKKALGIPEGKFVFGCLNHPKKITNEEILTWSEILNERKDSVILIYDGGEELTVKNLVSEFQKIGILKNRLVFTGKMPLKKHWSRFAHIDLFLDTFIVNGHTTLIEALRFGVPAISFLGEGNYGKYGASILNAAGLGLLVCNTKEEYVNKALFYSEWDENNKLKVILNESIDQNSLFNINQNIKNLEKAFEQIIGEPTYKKVIYKVG